MPNRRRRGKPLVNNDNKNTKNLTGSEQRALKRECTKVVDEALTDIFQQLNIHKEDFPKEYARIRSYAVEMNRPVSESFVEKNKAAYQREIASLVEKAKWFYYPKEAAAEALMVKQQQEYDVNKKKQDLYEFSNEETSPKEDEYIKRQEPLSYEELSVEREFVFIDDDERK